MNFLQRAIRGVIHDEFSTLAAKGYTFQLDYEIEEGYEISYSDGPESHEDIDTLMDGIYAVDMATVHCNYDGEPAGSVLLIPCNDYDIVSDWSYCPDDVDGRYAAPIAAWERIIKELDTV